MAEPTSPLPTDPFSLALKEKRDNPGAFTANSTIHLQDVYGNSETWVAETYRTEDGKDTVFLQRSAAAIGMRLVLPPEVTAALARHRDQLVTRVRKRAARRAVATKQAKKGGR